MRKIILLLLLLIPVTLFSQWSLDSTITTNKNLVVKKGDKGLILGINVEDDKHVRNGVMQVRLVIITDSINGVDYITYTTGNCNKGFITISHSVESELYFKYLLQSQKIEVHLRVQTNVQWLQYDFESGNFNKAYNKLKWK